MERTEYIPSSSASQDTTKANSDGEGGQFAFLIHSQPSVNKKPPPDIDDQRLARQKRRRTSPEDHAILEAEYEKNPKPDKAARIEIVNRVALGEKEVQIWFQNRRQMTRRKSRPLISTEIFCPSQGQSDCANTSSFPAHRSSQQHLSPSRSTMSNSHSAAVIFPMILPLKAPAVTDSSSSSQNKAEQSSGEGASRSLDSAGLDATQSSQTSASSDRSTQQAIAYPTELVRSLSQTAPTKRRPGYLKTRHSAPFLVHDEHYDTAPPAKERFGQTDCVPDTVETSKSLKRTTSQVRLSLSLDGKAEVTTRTGMTPSPPRSQPLPLSNAAPRANVGLQRSFSAVDPTNKSAGDVFQMPYTRRPMTGRSRDARTWEFYCDSDARNALTEQAQREEKGSATAAIGLIRSRSQNNKVMTPNPNKRNAHSQKAESTKRLKGNNQETSKPKLMRATSSLARLQTTNGNSVKQRAANAGGKNPKSGSQSAIYQEYEGDSDKENWEPGTQMSNPRRRRTGSQRVNRILEESLRVPSQSSSLDALMNHQASVKSSDENSPSPEMEEGVAAFMGENVPHEEEELDCVQNLLSLSQAAWQ